MLMTDDVSCAPPAGSVQVPYGNLHLHCLLSFGFCFVAASAAWLASPLCCSQALSFPGPPKRPSLKALNRHRLSPYLQCQIRSASSQGRRIDWPAEFCTAFRTIGSIRYASEHSPKGRRSNVYRSCYQHRGRLVLAASKSVVYHSHGGPIEHE